jgi:hypothetical protein
MAGSLSRHAAAPLIRRLLTMPAATTHTQLVAARAPDAVNAHLHCTRSELSHCAAKISHSSIQAQPIVQLRPKMTLIGGTSISPVPICDRFLSFYAVFICCPFASVERLAGWVRESGGGGGGASSLGLRCTWDLSQ